jgi:hypothetical protein
MTEQEWLAGAEPKRMLAFRQGRARWRKRLLYGCACCRLIWPLLTDEDSRQAVAICERHAEGQAARGEVEAISGAAEAARRGAWEAHQASFGPLRALFERGGRAGWEEPAYGQYRLTFVVTQAAAAPCQLLGCCREPGAPWNNDGVERAAAGASHAWRIRAWQSPAARQAATRWMRAARADLLRDLFGNPFRPVALDPAWLTPTVQALAQAAYEERVLPSGELDLARLKVLADSLEEAGCSQAAVLDHLRGPGPHVLGCWAVDLVLGRK